MNKVGEIVSKNYIFSENAEGVLVFKGNFEEYYKDVGDPWGQSAAADQDMDTYYRLSRERVNTRLKSLNPKTVLEVGCGLGFALNDIAKGISADFSGTDISTTAIDKAKNIFPNYHFFSSDITVQNVSFKKEKYDVIILNQLLWYILPSLKIVVENMSQHLLPGGVFIVSNAFARNQRYGKEFIDGFSGAWDYFSTCSIDFVLRDAQFTDDGLRVMDGIFVLEKK